MRPTLLAAAVLLVVMTGCSSVRGERTTTGFADQATQTELDVPASTVVASPAPVGSAVDFTASMLVGGQRVEGADLLGQGSVIMTFVQPGCEISAADSPSIAQAAQNHPELTYVFLHSGATDSDYREMVDTAGLEGENIVHLVDDRGVTERFGVTAFPTTVIVDSAGALTSAVGVLDAEGQERAASLALG